MIPTPTARLLRMVRSRWLVVLEPSGRFDEAGIHSESAVIVVAGYLAGAKDWAWLEKKWQAILNDEGVEFYHATDIEAEPPRGIYKGWTRARADRLTDLVVPIATRFKGTPFGVHIKADSWYAAVPFVKDNLPERAHDGPYTLLAKDVIEQVIASRINCLENPSRSCSQRTILLVNSLLCTRLREASIPARNCSGR
jgi:hypothetical protein